MPKTSKWRSNEDPGDRRPRATAESLPLIGQRVEQYEILQLLGKGGFGEVYRAYDFLLDREVAIKVLPEEFSDDPVRRERLIREARAASRLSHGNICAIHQLVVVDGRTFIVMEYVRGETLWRVCRQERLSARRVIRIGIQLASALSAAHRLGIIHRDVKSSNIVLNPEGDAKILDFGMAKFCRPNGLTGSSAAMEALTEEGSIVGSVAYMSPEQLRAEQVDPRTDLFSLGVVLYELATGTLPFQGQSQFDLAHAILTHEPPSLPLSDPESALLQEVVSGLMAKRREDRFQTAESVLKALRPGPAAESPGPEGTEQVVPVVDTSLDSPTLGIEGSRRSSAPSLPHLANRLVGRDAEIFELSAWVEDPQNRLITLVGPGGVGKSSLALAVAHQEAERFAQGSCFVPLAHTAPSLVVTAIAQGVGYTFHGAEDPTAQLAEHLSDSDSLIILDNFEHLISASELVAELLGKCPHCTWLVTSRERLNLRGERVFEVTGLSYPEDGETDPQRRYSAVDLFSERARQCDASFRAEAELSQIHEICRLTSGLPLGLELAAAWVRLMSCGEIVSQIKENIEFLSSTSRDRPDRHRTLAIVFEYSWNLLNEREKEVFQSLSIFHGGFDREAAKVVCGASLRDLLPLLDKSLLRKESSGRLVVHELLRKFADKKLREDDLEFQRVRDRHSDHYSNCLRQQREKLRGGDLKAALETIRAELRNIRRGIEWAVETRRFEPLGRCLEDAMLFFEITSRFKEGYDFFSKISESLTGSEPEDVALAAQALAATALFSVYLGRYEEAVKLGKRALSLVDPEKVDETIATGYSHYSIGQAEQAMGHYDTALEEMKDSLEAFGAYDGAYWANHASIAMAQLHSWRGEEEEARRRYLKGVRGCEKIRDVWGMKAGLTMLGSLDLQRGDLESAKSMFTESLDFARELEDRRGIANCLAQLGQVAFESGDFEEARRLSRESVALAVEMRDKHRHLKYLIWLSKVEDRAGDAVRSEEVLLEALRLSRQSSAVPEMLEILLEIARRRHLGGDREEAILLLGLVVDHPGTRRHALAEARGWLSGLKQEIGAKKVERLLAQGSRLELEPTVVEILGKRGPGGDGGGEPGVAQ